ncbi:MAG: formate acetyltransferase [Nitrospirae bacterium]|nr:formate acetyltransferase [Nitrospirota bacterium]
MSGAFLSTQPALDVSDRVRALHEEVRGSAPGLCAERALLVTRYFKGAKDGGVPLAIRKARALAHILVHKTVRIHPRELLVGNFTSYRVGGQLFPELHGLGMMEDLFRFPRRAVNPLRVAPADRRRLLREVLPFWATRVMMVKARPFPESVRFLREMADPTHYLINEVAGISHFVPDYPGLVARGMDGYRQEIAQRKREVETGSGEAHFLDAAGVACDALDLFADRYRLDATARAGEEKDPVRRDELEAIAAVCGRVPRKPARTFREALQAILFAQIALNLESLDNSVCPGRLDQILNPYYQKDCAEGRLDRDGALELLGCFAVKLCEIVPAFSRRGTRFHGGMFNGQVVVVGGTDREGRDVSNDVTFLLLELMDALRTRQPNYHARVHSGSPSRYRARIASALARGAVSPAVYNDDVIVPLLQGRGIAPADARDYANVGCVEPVAAGKSFLSTDAALFNLPLCLELALNRGRRFGALRRIGAATPDPSRCGALEDLVEWFRLQVEWGVTRLLEDLRGVERANARWHPTPLTSMLLEGCLEGATDSTAGGARYNGSGIQGVGVVEVGDSLAAIEDVVFRKRAATLGEVARACRRNFRGFDDLHARLCGAPKYGNDDAQADRCVGRAIEVFESCLRGKQNTRGGEYAAGFYSVTSHVAFGLKVGALPSGRGAGESFSSGISAGSGRDRHGPTALLRSQAALPLHLAGNGVNFNLQMDPWAVKGADGAVRLRALIDGAFAAGCMQMQVNVLDPKVLIEARDNPTRYPGLLVRVSGYSAYFNDLSPAMKEEIIRRTIHSAPGEAPGAV